MSDIPGTSRAQTKFLRAFVKEPFGPNVRDWPSPAVMRRWLRKPGFVAAMRSVRDAIRYQSDFQLLSAAGAAAHVVHTSVTAGGEDVQKDQIMAMGNLLKLLHVRERFMPEEPPLPINEGVVVDLVRTSHRDTPIGNLRQFLRIHHGIDLDSHRKPTEQIQDSG